MPGNARFLRGLEKRSHRAKSVRNTPAARLTQVDAG
ncbi:MAG: hypothetical protein QOF78_199 [Phycisphaerales bacterium]|jgi:hypothetical protein|nr:hypothetical protein [Phycisphaerales bacterium]